MLIAIYLLRHPAQYPASPTIVSELPHTRGLPVSPGINAPSASVHPTQLAIMAYRQRCKLVGADTRFCLGRLG